MSGHEDDLIHPISWLNSARADPARYRDLAAAAIREGPADPSTSAVLHAIVARTTLDLEGPDDAIVAAEVAVAQLPDSAPGELRAELAGILATALISASRLNDAVDVLDQSEMCTSDPEVRAILDVSRCVAAYRQGDLVRAHDIVDRALADLSPHRSIDRARAHNNRGILQLYLGDLAGARLDLDVAEGLYRQHNHFKMAAEVVHNRAMVLARVGDLPGAMRDFNAAQHELASLGFSTAQTIVDASEVMALAGLCEDVLDQVPDAIRELQALGLTADAADGMLYLAMARARVGHPNAIDAARESASAFVASGRTGWASIAEDLLLQCAIEADGFRAVSIDDAQRVARQLDDHGMTVFAATSWLRVANVCEAVGEVEQGSAALAEVEHRKSTMTLRLLACEAAAMRHLAEGDRDQCRRWVARGRSLLERHRALFESTELRANASAWGAGLARLDVGLAWDERPARLLAAVERWRANSMDHASKEHEDPDIRILLSVYRVMAAALAAELRDGQPSVETSARAHSSEHALTTALRSRQRRRPQRMPRQTTVAEIRAGLGSTTLVAYVEHLGLLRALIVRSDGISSVDIGSSREVARLAKGAISGLRQLSPVVAAPAARLVARTCSTNLQRLRSLLWAPLATRVEIDDLVIVPSSELHALPWSFLVGATRSVSVVPSAGVWLRAAPHPLDGRVLLVAGPGLPGAVDEVAALRTIHPISTALVGPDATADRVIEGLDGAAVAHLATHAVFRSAKPLFSYMQLADGPVTAHDFDLLERPPGLVVLSACRTAEAANQAGGELLGLSSVLIAGGTSCVVVATVPLVDDMIAPLMSQFHSTLRRSFNVGDALAYATARNDPESPVGLLERCAFSVLGRGDVRLGPALSVETPATGA